jgi:hypothetical protein
VQFVKHKSHSTFCVSLPGASLLVSQLESNGVMETVIFFVGKFGIIVLISAHQLPYENPGVKSR